MPQFIKRPVTITADQWFKNGDHPEDYAKPAIFRATYEQVAD